MRIFRTTRTLRRLDEMLTKAINGTFTEEAYNETELSRLESKWKQYFTMSGMSMERTKTERENIKSMISDISHQMKTPLANIMLYSELLQEQTEGEQEKYLAEQIETYAKKLEFLTTALVKMSRLESDVFEICPSVQQIESLVTAAAAEIMPKAKKKQIQVEIRGEMEERRTLTKSGHRRRSIIFWTMQSNIPRREAKSRWKERHMRCISVLLSKIRGSGSGKKSGHRFSLVFTGQTWCSRKKESGSDCIWRGKSSSERVAISK